jgi:hypothetical protein
MNAASWNNRHAKFAVPNQRNEKKLTFGCDMQADLHKKPSTAAALNSYTLRKIY